MLQDLISIRDEQPIKRSDVKITDILTKRKNTVIAYLKVYAQILKNQGYNIKLTTDKIMEALNTIIEKYNIGSALIVAELEQYIVELYKEPDYKDMFLDMVNNNYDDNILNDMLEITNMKW